MSKTTLNEQNKKTQNIGIFSDTSGRVYESYHLDWSTIYSIFDNDDFSRIRHDQRTFVNIRESKLHSIAAIPALMPYTNSLKWIIHHAKPQENTYNDQDQT